MLNLGAKKFLFVRYNNGMSISNFIKNTCYKLGSNNKSIYPVIAIATANGICRPTFTMLKKGENPTSKKYAALREGITEAIAVPTYWVCGVLAAKCGEKIASTAMDKKLAKLEEKNLTNEVKAEMKNSAIKKGQAGLMLVGVCLAAGVVIPALCSLLVTPIMNRIKKNNFEIKEHNPVKFYNYPQTPQQFISRPYKNNYGMKVGGV